MSAVLRLSTARRYAESLMSGRCTITRFIPAKLDTATLNLIDVDPNDDKVYDGHFRVKEPHSNVVALNTEGNLLAAQQLVLCVPVAVGALVALSDLVTVIDGGLEPGLAGRQFRIAGRQAQSWATEARLPIESLAS